MLNEPGLAEPAEVRNEVIAQHERLRELLRSAIAASTKELRARGSQGEELAHLAHEIRRRFRAHLAREEQILVPVLSAADGWGPERVRNLLKEHVQQRNDLDELIAGIELGWGRERLALALRNVAMDLLRDMDEEERDYLSPNVLRDGVVITDQEAD